MKLAAINIYALYLTETFTKIRIFLQVVQFILVQIQKYHSILNQKDENFLALKSKSFFANFYQKFILFINNGYFSAFYFRAITVAFEYVLLCRH